MRTTIKALAHHRVLWTGEDEYGDVRSIEYFAPQGGGYVKVDDGRHYPQVCRDLARTGSTLIWDGREPLVELIRREHAASKRAERRAAAAYAAR